MSFIGMPDPSSSPAATDAPIDPTLEPLITDLELALRLNQERCGELDAYYRGKGPHSYDSETFQQAFGRQLRRFADNWLRFTVKATADRLVVQGFRVGSGDDTDAADDQAWRVWQANRMKARSKVAYRTAMKFGTCFFMVDPFDQAGLALGPGVPPRITVESPLHVVGQRDSQDPYKLLSAIKKWVGDDDRLYLNLYLPEYVAKFRSVATVSSMMPGAPGRVMQPASWAQIGEVDNPLGVVPIVAMENSPDVETGGESDLEDLIPLNDALNKAIRDLMVSAEFAAFAQRVIIGAEIPKDPRTGKPITEQQIQLMASRSRAWLFPNPNTKVESLPQADLTGYIETIDMLVHHIAALGALPAYMLPAGRMANLSADAIRAAELGFEGKLITKQGDFGVAQEQTIGLGLLSMNGPGSEPVIETIWKDAAANSGSILSNELVQMQALGVPQEVLWERWGASPQDVERWKAINKLNPPPSIEPPTLAPTGMQQGASGPPADADSAPDGQVADGTVQDS